MRKSRPDTEKRLAKLLEKRLGIKPAPAAIVKLYGDAFYPGAKTGPLYALRVGLQWRRLLAGLRVDG